MRELLETLRAWRAEGIGVGRAVLVRAFGSSPRQPGASLLVGDDGRMAGSVSGGCVEGAALEEVRRARRTGLSRLVRYGISDETAWDVGLACGGVIDVLIEPELRPEVIDAASAAAQGAAPRAIAIALPADGSGQPPEPSVEGAAASGALASAVEVALGGGGSAALEIDGRAWFVEAFLPPPRLVIVGAVHVAGPLAAYAKTLGYRTVVIDRRKTFAAGQQLAGVDQLIEDWPERAAEAIGLGRDDSVAVLSHDPKLDEPAIVEALRRGCRYVGAIGSRTTQADRRERLLAAGIGEHDLARLHGPIGLDLGGREPAEIALAIMAEIVAARRSGSGLPMAAAPTGASAT
ncbi:MAG: XdhC family protein [Candidatus Limnocylindria bacterium]